MWRTRNESNRTEQLKNITAADRQIDKTPRGWYWFSRPMWTICSVQQMQVLIPIEFPHVAAFRLHFMWLLSRISGLDVAINWM